MARKKKQISGRFVALPHALLNDHAWQGLTSDARCIFIELKRRYNGKNNGFIGLSYRDAAKTFNGGKDTARIRLIELQKAGFIRLTNKSHKGNRHATEWLLTTERDDRNNHAPSNDWKAYEKKASTGTGTVSTYTGTESQHQHH
jgi:hypothetical protein